jgi:signal transduction histidine kinase
MKMKNHQTETTEEQQLLQESNKEYIEWLETMMFFVSHKFRSPVASILGLSNVLNADKKSPEEMCEIIANMTQSALLLDKCSRELSKQINSKINLLHKKELSVNYSSIFKSK